MGETCRQVFPYDCDESPRRNSHSSQGETPPSPRQSASRCWPWILNILLGQFSPSWLPVKHLPSFVTVRKQSCPGGCHLSVRGTLCKRTVLMQAVHSPLHSEFMSARGAEWLTREEAHPQSLWGRWLVSTGVASNASEGMQCLRLAQTEARPNCPV